MAFVTSPGKTSHATETEASDKKTESHAAADPRTGFNKIRTPVNEVSKKSHATESEQPGDSSQVTDRGTQKKKKKLNMIEKAISALTNSDAQLTTDTTRSCNWRQREKKTSTSTTSVFNLLSYV